MRVLPGLVMLGAVVGSWPATSQARVLCEKRSGVVVVREACKRKEQPLDIAQFGAVGPQGEPGPPGLLAIHSVSTVAPGFFASLTSLSNGEEVAL